MFFVVYLFYLWYTFNCILPILRILDLTLIVMLLNEEKSELLNQSHFGIYYSLSSKYTTLSSRSPLRVLHLYVILTACLHLCEYTYVHIYSLTVRGRGRFCDSKLKAHVSAPSVIRQISVVKQPLLQFSPNSVFGWSMQQGNRKPHELD